SRTPVRKYQAWTAHCSSPPQPPPLCRGNCRCAHRSSSAKTSPRSVRARTIDSPANAARHVRPGLTLSDFASGYQKSGWSPIRRRSGSLPVGFRAASLSSPWLPRPRPSGPPRSLTVVRGYQLANGLQAHPRVATATSKVAPLWLRHRLDRETEPRPDRGGRTKRMSTLAWLLVG